MPSAERSPNSPLRYLDRNRRTGLAAVLCLTALCYANIFFNQFACDDLAFLVEWPLIKDLANWPQFFGPENQPPDERGVYSPLKTVIHALTVHFFGNKPFGYHVLSVLIHLLGTMFVFLICRAVTRHAGIAVLSAFIFGIHPVQTEAVTFMTASVDTLGIVAMFAAVYFFIRKNNRLSLLTGALAIFTHELALTLPLLLSWYMFCFDQKRATRLWPFFAVAAVYVLLKGLVLGDVARGEYLMGSAGLTALVTLKALLKYLQVLSWPVSLPLNPELSPGIYSVNIHWFDRQKVLAQSISDPQVLISVALLLTALAACVYCYQRNKTVAFAIGWFYISLLPVMNIIPSESYFGLRYLYPGMLGVSLLAATGLDVLTAKAKPKTAGIAIAIFILIAAFWMTQTFKRNADWKNNLAFYEAEAREAPANSHVRVDLALLYKEKGDMDKARQTIEDAAALRPEDPDLLFVLGQIRREAGDLAGAIAAYRLAVKLEPRYSFAQLNLANALWENGDTEEAKAGLRKAIRLFRQNGEEEWLKMAEELYRANFP